MRKRIPGFWLGILFSFLPISSSTASLDLAVDLFEEGDWPACRVECERELIAEPGDSLAALLRATCRARMGGRGPGIRAEFAGLAGGAAPAEIRSMAAFEAARLAWADGDTAAAFAGFRQAFRETSVVDIFARSGWALHEIRREDPTLGADDAVLVQQLETCAALWTPQIVRDMAAGRSEAGAMLARPGQWIVMLYRGLVRPALGARCSLSPNCSEYFFQASARHGLLAFPMAADRLVREPSVVQAAERLVEVGGKTLIADPLSDHDHWMGAK